MLEGVPKVYYFTDRKKIAQEIVLPKNDVKRPYLILYPNDIGTGYKQIKYEEYREWFGVHLTFEDVRSMINNFNKVHTYILKEQKAYEEYNDNNFIYKLMVIISVLSIIFSSFIFVYVTLYNSGFSRKREAYLLAFFSASLALITAFILPCVSCKRIPRFKPYHEQLTKKMGEALKRQNNRFYKKGITILPGKKYIYLEIWKTKLYEEKARPMVSLLGEDPIPDPQLMGEEEMAEFLKEKLAEMEETFKRRSNIRYKRYIYMKEFLKAEIQRLKELRKKQEEAAEKAQQERMLSRVDELAEEHEMSTTNQGGKDLSLRDPGPDLNLIQEEEEAEGEAPKE